MSIAPQKFREIVFQLLYSHDISQADEAEMIRLICAELEVNKKVVKSAQQVLDKVIEKLPEIDQLIATSCTAYAFDRIQTVEKNILRLGTYELLFDTELPTKVAIAEAMRLTRKFGSPEAVNFVNAILDSILKKTQNSNEFNENQLAQSIEQLIKSEESIQNLAEQIKSIPKQDPTDED